MTKDNLPVVLSVKGVYKNFKLPHEQVTSIKRFVTQGFRKERKGYEIQHALKDINIDIKKGEFFGIVGRNGSGKSTLLKILAGIYQPTKGTVKAHGKLVPFIELGVGFNPELTGRENVYLNGALLGFTKKEIDAQYDDIVQFAELERFMDQKLKNYSSGMQVRLAFSVATRAKADILLVDEVLAVGDADFQRKCFNYFKKLKKDKKTVVFVSHDMNAVREYCDRAVLIEKSEIIESGNVAKVASAYTKMFMDGGAVSDSKDKITKKRWGNGDIEFTSVTVAPHVPTEKDETLVIKASFEVHTDDKESLFGMKVKNGVGTEMVGTNNKLLHLTSPTLKRGDKGEVVWRVPNILNNGDYSVDVAVIDADDLSEMDWWEDAHSFSVVRDEHSSFVVEPLITMEFKS